jgi:hypothetical protein
MSLTLEGEKPYHSPEVKPYFTPYFMTIYQLVDPTQPCNYLDLDSIPAERGKRYIDKGWILYPSAHIMPALQESLTDQAPLPKEVCDELYAQYDFHPHFDIPRSTGYPFTFVTTISNTTGVVPFFTHRIADENSNLFEPAARFVTIKKNGQLTLLANTKKGRKILERINTDAKNGGILDFQRFVPLIKPQNTNEPVNKEAQVRNAGERLNARYLRKLPGLSERSLLPEIGYILVGALPDGGYHPVLKNIYGQNMEPITCVRTVYTDKNRVVQPTSVLVIRFRLEEYMRAAESIIDQGWDYYMKATDLPQLFELTTDLTSQQYQDQLAIRFAHVVRNYPPIEY